MRPNRLKTIAAGILALGLTGISAASAAPVSIISYDFFATPLSGHGNWSHAYGGTIAVTGPSFSNNGSPGTLANYSGGSGTLNDGVIGSSTGNTHLFVAPRASDGTPIAPVITLYLGGMFTINTIEIFAGTFGNAIPGTLTGMTVGLAASSAALVSTAFNTVDDRLTITGSPLDGLVDNKIVLSLPTGGWFEWFSITEIKIDGTAASAVPEPMSLALFGFGLAGLGLIRRRRVI